MLLFELPYSERLKGSRSARITREIVHAEFPDPDRWLPIDVRGASYAGRTAFIWTSGPR